MKSTIKTEQFVKLFAGTSSIYRKLSESLYPFRPHEQPSPSEKQDFLTNLCNSINSGHYFPQPPRGYLVEPKINGVPRFIPVMHFADALVYYYCVKQLTYLNPFGRAIYTYGGFQRGADRILEERAELDSIGERIVPDPGYPFDSSVDPGRFRRIWKGFQRAAYIHSRDGTYTSFATLDIANFYDTINLDILERMIRSHTYPDQSGAVDLLMVFLNHWNRSVEGYGKKSVGLPMEEIGDNSRHLANYYLLGFDDAMNVKCRKFVNRARYLRFADDQILMAHNRSEISELLYDAGNELRKLGLSINSGKVNHFDSRDDFDHYWQFEAFNGLGDLSDSQSLNRFALHYLTCKEQLRNGSDPRPIRLESMLNALIYRLDDVNLDPEIRKYLIDQIIESGIFLSFESKKLSVLMSVLSAEQRFRLDNESEAHSIDAWNNRYVFTLAQLIPQADRPDWLSVAIDLHRSNPWTS